MQLINNEYIFLNKSDIYPIKMIKDPCMDIKKSQITILCNNEQIVKSKKNPTWALIQYKDVFLPV